MRLSRASSCIRYRFWSLGFARRLVPVTRTYCAVRAVNPKVCPPDGFGYPARETTVDQVTVYARTLRDHLH